MLKVWCDHVLTPSCTTQIQINCEYKMKQFNELCDFASMIFLGLMHLQCTYTNAVYSLCTTQTIFKQPSLSIRCSSVLVVPNTARGSFGLSGSLNRPFWSSTFVILDWFLSLMLRGNPTASCCYQQHRNINTYIDQASHSVPG